MRTIDSSVFMNEYNVTKYYFALQTALPSAAVFTVLSDNEDTDTGDEEVLHNNSYEVSPSTILTFSKKVRNFLEFVPGKKQPY